jgi:transposase
MIATEIRNSVRVLKQQSQSLRAISNLLKLTRNTVRRILRERKAAATPSCEPQTLARLKDAFARGGGNVMNMQRMLAEEKLEVPYSTLTRWVRKAGLRSPPSIIAAQKWLTGIRVKNGRQRERKKALTILARKRGITNANISVILNSARRTTRRNFKVYSEGGASALFGPNTQHIATPPRDSEKTGHILEFLHQKPISFGINRTSWTHRALIQAYKERYNETISRRTVSRLIKNAGYSWKKARRVAYEP